MQADLTGRDTHRDRDKPIAIISLLALFYSTLSLLFAQNLRGAQR
jgi:hypothetical protein